MRISTSMRWLVVALSAAMLLAVAAACSSETIEVPGETVVVEKVVTETVEVPGETVVVEKEVIKTVEVPGETVVKEVVKEVMVPGETVVVKEEVVKTVEVPGQTVVKEVVKTVEVPGETVVVEKEVVKTVEVPGETVVVTKEVAVPVEVVREVPSGKNYVTDPVFGTVVSAPEYGGTITQVLKHAVDRRLDAHIGGYAALYIASGVLEKLSMVDWAIDRDIYPFVGGVVAPAYALRGALAESWEQPDPKTYVFNIRQGVQWHDKPPVNGRELTAYDVEHSYHRMLGNKLTGTEFSEAEPSTTGGPLAALPWESVEATDKWTVVMKLKEPRLDALSNILDWASMVIQPPELLEEYGDDWDWQNVVGTGPYMITDLVPGSSVTWTKNPNYWGYDEKYPENRLPYIDEMKGLEIIEVATSMAGLRTGKIDFIGWPGASQLNAIDQADSLMQTNPELVIHTWSERSNAVTTFNHRQPPYTDIRVRRAMQMALDLETVNATYYKGHADTIPQGPVSRLFEGYVVPFEEWPEEIKGYYTYDTAGAEKLLDEAGYPRGADGIRFKTTFLQFLRYDLGWVELAAAYWRDIGVDVVIETPSVAERSVRAKVGEFGLMEATGGGKGDPLTHVGWFYSEAGERVTRHGLSDAQYDALFEAALAATTMEEQQRLIKEMDMYAIEQHLQAWGPLAPEFTVHQPWVIGYNGEGGFGGAQNQVVFSRLWIDSELKEAMGH